MKYVKTFWLLAILAGSFSCKVKRQDTQVNFVITLQPGDQISSYDTCFDEIHAIGRPELSDKCVDSLDNRIILPLNINTDTTAFAFRIGERRDTLVLKHHIAIKDDNGEYFMELKNTRLIKSTFDSIKVVNNTNKEHKNDFTNIEGITIYY